MMDSAQDQPRTPPEPYTPLALSKWGVIRSIFYGVGVSLGLSLLWFMEVVRNFYFRALDRLNIKIFWRRAGSAFPPGKPRKRRQTPSST